MNAIEQLRAHLASSSSGYAGDETTLELTVKGLLEVAERLEFHAEVFGKINERLVAVETRGSGG